jgi:hypothetical protein
MPASAQEIRQLPGHPWSSDAGEWCCSGAKAVPAKWSAVGWAAMGAAAIVSRGA